MEFREICTMLFYQRDLKLKSYPRGFHLITNYILNGFPELREIKKGQLQVFIQHTSASLCINENADPTVRVDFESHFNKMVPEEAPYYVHTYEGPDDMPAHIKAAMLGSSIAIPIKAGKLHLGIWQGIYLCEHRNAASGRNLVLSAFGV